MSPERSTLEPCQGVSGKNQEWSQQEVGKGGSMVSPGSTIK